MHRVIKLQNKVHTAGLFARMTWQVLFDHYRNNDGDLNDMDSILCDFDILQKLFDEALSKRQGFTRHWSFCRAYTEMADYGLIDLENNVLKIEYGNDKISITTAMLIRAI